MHIVIADDHRLVLDALWAFLKTFHPEMEISKATDLRLAMQIAASAKKPDLLVLDLNMPGMNGLEGLDTVRKRFPDIPVVLISGQFTTRQVKESLRRGASGFIPKDMSGEAMVKALELVLSGSIYVPIAALDETSDEDQGEKGDGEADQELIDLLTKREYEVIKLLTEGYPNKKIGRELDLTESTVAFHLRSAYRKLDVSSRTAAMRAATELGLTSWVIELTEQPLQKRTVT